MINLIHPMKTIFPLLEVQQILQAEDATWDGPTLKEGYDSTGNGLLDFQGATGDYIEWTFCSDMAGPETIAFRYALDGSPRPLELKVNGIVLDSSLNFPSTASWSDWQLVEVEVPLVEGDNLIRITAVGQSGGNFDSLIVGGSTSHSGSGGKNSTTRMPILVQKVSKMAIGRTSACIHLSALFD